MFVRILQGDIPRHNPLLLRSLGHLNEVECRFPFFIMTVSCQNPPSFQSVAARFRFNKCESSPSLGLWFVFFINSISGRMINHHYSGCSRKINAGLANDVLSQFTMTMTLKSLFQANVIFQVMIFPKEIMVNSISAYQNFLKSKYHDKPLATNLNMEKRGRG